MTTKLEQVTVSRASNSNQSWWWWSCRWWWWWWWWWYGGVREETTGGCGEEHGESPLGTRTVLGDHAVEHQFLHPWWRWWWWGGQEKKSRGTGYWDMTSKWGQVREGWNAADSRRGLFTKWQTCWVIKYIDTDFSANVICTLLLLNPVFLLFLFYSLFFSFSLWSRNLHSFCLRACTKNGQTVVFNLWM